MKKMNNASLKELVVRLDERMESVHEDVKDLKADVKKLTWISAGLGAIAGVSVATLKSFLL